MPESLGGMKMAINKEKNQSVMITMDKDLLKAVDSLIDTFNTKFNAKMSKSKLIEQAIVLYIDYLRGNINVKIQNNKKGD